MYCIFLQMKNSIIILILVFIFLLGSSPIRHLNATPAAEIELPEPVTALIVFPTGRWPDREGNFEVEAYCETQYDIEEVKIVVYHSEEIFFDDEIPTFQGKMSAGESKLWIIKGTVKSAVKIDELELPAVIRLTVNYLFPDKAVLEDIKNSYPQNSQMRSYALKKLERVKGKTQKVVKLLVVPIPKPVKGAE